ncbi:uncharacterized protein TrAtP1_008296 [Trichoderma atroviride]|uniref:uncharacterized protein n=1 Tax=Hypocrea atroviridis TaxID=63577 RepID=UPI00332C06D0|nr:hypothetical protein TrAtP1_008296 [Trichoderma atroviride]
MGQGGSRPRVWVTDLSTVLYLYSTQQTAPHSTLVRVAAKSSGCVLPGLAGPLESRRPNPTALARHGRDARRRAEGWAWTARLGLKHAATSWLAGHSPYQEPSSRASSGYDEKGRGRQTSGGCEWNMAYLHGHSEEALVT